LSNAPESRKIIVSFLGDGDTGFGSAEIGWPRGFGFGVGVVHGSKSLKYHTLERYENEEFGSLIKGRVQCPGIGSPSSPFNGICSTSLRTLQKPSETILTVGKLLCLLLIFQLPTTVY
jgi:hypothetical protein